MTIIFIVGVVLVMVGFLIAVGLCRSAAEGDRIIEQSREGSLQARVDEERARESLRVQRTVHAEPIRRTPGGWRAS